MKLVAQVMLINLKFDSPCKKPLTGTSINSKVTSIKIVGSVKVAILLPVVGDEIPVSDPIIIANSMRLLECHSKVNALLKFVFDIIVVL